MPSTSTRAIVAGSLAVLLLVAGGAAYLFVARRAASGDADAPAATPYDPSAPRAATITAEFMADNDITVAPVAAAALSHEVEASGTIEPSVAQQTSVVATVAGRITRSDVEVGQAVTQGQTLAELYSPDLADAQRAYLAATAAVRAHQTTLGRLEALLEKGAVPRQEVERARTEHTALVTAVDAARARLDLLGLTRDQVTALSSESAITSTATVVAPIDGVVITKSASVDAAVLAGAPLFTVANLRTVWAVAELGQVDVSRIHTGNAVVLKRPPDIAAMLGLPPGTVIPGVTPSPSTTAGTSSAPNIPPSAAPAAPTGAPGAAPPAGGGPDSFQGTITYIDPQVSSATKTSKVRADVVNDAQALAPGMSVQMTIAADAGLPGIVIPRIAIQKPVDEPVVYVRDPENADRFVERPIKVGREVGEMIEVTSGLAAGDIIVVEGSSRVMAATDR